jgi:DNA primase
LLLKLSAPLLRLQLVKRLAEVTGFSQREVERLCELRPIAPPAPARAPRQAPSLMRGLIEVLLQKPELAHDLPLTLLPGNDPEVRAVTRLAQLILASDAPLPYATLIERLRDSSEEGLIREVAGRLLQNPVGEDGDNGTVLDEVWRGYLDQLTRDQLDQEFQRLTKKAQEAGLDADEKQEYARLVVEMNRLGRVSRRR